MTSATPIAKPRDVVWTYFAGVAVPTDESRPVVGVGGLGVCASDCRCMRAPGYETRTTAYPQPQEPTLVDKGSESAFAIFASAALKTSTTLTKTDVGPDDDEIRTGNAMVLDPYGEVIAETRSFDDAMVVADLDASLLPMSSGRRWLRARRPELYASLTEPTGQELATWRVRFGEASE